jgi:hypothetical protein
MTHTAQVTLADKTVNEDGTIQVTFDDGTGYLYGDEASLQIDCEMRDNDLPTSLKSYLICMLVEQGLSTVGKTLFIDLNDAQGNIVKVI